MSRARSPSVSPDLVRFRKRRGYHAENKLRQILEKKKGRYVFRTPVSGARTDLPDLFVIDAYSKEVIAFEVKSTTKNSVTVEKHQLYKMKRFLTAFKALAKRVRAVLAVYSYKLKEWVFIDLGDLTQEKYREDQHIKITDQSTWKP